MAGNGCTGVLGVVGNGGSTDAMRMVGNGFRAVDMVGKICTGVVVRIDCLLVENMVGIDGTIAMDMFCVGCTRGWMDMASVGFTGAADMVGLSWLYWSCEFGRHWL